MSKFPRLIVVSVVAVLLPACSTDITRFDYPIMGMNDAPPPAREQAYRDPYADRNTYQQSSQNQQNYQNSYQQSGRDRLQQTYQQGYDRRQPQDRYVQYDRRTDPRYDRRSYETRDVYDTASTDKPDQRDDYKHAPYQRDQLPALNQERERADRTSFQDQRQQVAAKVVPAPARRDASGRHIVAHGDTLYNISKRYHVRVEEIRRANDLYGNDIKLGQALVIPGVSRVEKSPASTASLGKDGVYQVGQGDTVYNISRRFGVSREALAEANGIDDMSQVKLGQKLIIPGKERKGRVKKPVKVVSLEKRSGLKTPARPMSRLQSAQKSVAPSGNRFIWPARGTILSGFGRQKSGIINDGVNLALPRGTAVKAADDGVVAYAGNELKGYGNLVLVRHANNWVTAYAHNSKLMVKRGQKVRRGQVIAKSGKSGSVMQPQLHFELRKGSKPVNPQKYIAMR